MLTEIFPEKGCRKKNENGNSYFHVKTGGFFCKTPLHYNFPNAPQALGQAPGSGPPHALALFQVHLLYAGDTLADAKMRCFGFDRLRHEAGHGKPWSTMACHGQNRKSRTTKRPPKVVQGPSCSKSRPESPKSAEMGPKRLSDLSLIHI